MKMICENAGKCEVKCSNGKQHEADFQCEKPCAIKGGIFGSKCIPYIEPSKPFDGAPDLLAKETERKMAHVEAIISKPLTGHAKYCRLSKQAGGLCNHKVNSVCKFNEFLTGNTIHDDWTACPRPEKQQPVELPKDPLEEVIKKYSGIIYDNYVDETFAISCIERALREFAEKVMAL